jgi:intracellular sulfur oxidation DsrE/DsrF family protein
MAKVAFGCFVFLLSVVAVSGQSMKPSSPVIADADGFAMIPNAAFPPDKKRVYRAIYDSTKFAKEPSLLLPAINNAGSELNALGVSGIPMTNAKFAVVFHGASVDGILDDAHYRAKYGIANPNLSAIAQMTKAGVKFYVCGQYLLGENIDPKTLTPDVVVASDALVVLMSLQNDGYALMSY